VQERVAVLTEVAPMIAFMFNDELEYEEAAMKVMQNPVSLTLLDEIIPRYAAAEWKHTVLHDIMLEVAEANELKLGKAQAPIRLAVTGKKVGPPLFESLELLGRERVIERLTRLRDTVRAA
jgi:glutamyl-tRNA synthetase